MKQTLATIISNDEIIPGTHLVWLESPETATTARPGQFVMVGCGEDTLLRRPLSVHQVDGEKLAILFAAVGKGTNWLARRKTGDKIDLFGPLGNSYTINPSATNLLLVAGGIGIAPLRYLADEATKQGREVTLLLGAHSESQLYPERLLPSGIKTLLVTNNGTAGKKGMVTDLLTEQVNRADQILACGPLPMYQTMAQMPELSNKSVQVSLEIVMACGVGACYGCTIKTSNGLKQVCKDGPVFNLNDILWEELT